MDGIGMNQDLHCQYLLRMEKLKGTMCFMHLCLLDVLMTEKDICMILWK